MEKGVGVDLQLFVIWIDLIQSFVENFLNFPFLQDEMSNRYLTNRYSDGQSEIIMIRIELIQLSLFWWNHDKSVS